MRHLRVLAVLLALVVSAQTLVDRCLLVCHEASASDAPHCHDTGDSADDLRLVDLSGCAHGHDDSWIATTNVGADRQASVAAGISVAISWRGTAPALSPAVAVSAGALAGCSRSIPLPLRI